ncbi:hypothetical protein [Hymenobacter lapidiphilus]|uniref:DUF4177 domain-containing protein n=1 Tax=Hymenobacter lapidiphilus TaxID=2608003 RepID=A0A7Y7U6E5_9BACT|nr:hypothetical protein [Hymenobacter lapidiphilus]NVO32292.1 hypothetical protein [Hymenobacter lapidiphilus]
MKTTLLALALCGAPAFAFAQSAPVAAYEFLTVAELKQDSDAKLLFAPAFDGKTEVQLARLPGATTNNRAKFVATYRQNLELVNQHLAAVTAAGWELVQASPGTAASGHEYLFRRLKK